MYKLYLNKGFNFKKRYSKKDHWFMSFSEVYCLGIDMKELVAQSCLTICHPMDCSPPGFSVHGILLVRILEWVEDPGIFPTPPGIEPRCPALQADSLPSEPAGKPWDRYV